MTRAADDALTRTMSVRFLALTLGTVTFTGALIGVIVVPAIPDLPRLYGVSMSDASWTLTAGLVTQAIAAPVAGSLGDLFGNKRVILLLLLLMAVGSLMVALSDSLAIAVTGRALQGTVGGAIPLAIGILHREVPQERLNNRVSFLSATLGLGAAGGLPLSAALVESWDFRTLFWVSFFLAVLCSILVVVAVPGERKNPERRPFDFAGTAGLSLGLTGLLLALSKGSDWGWTSPTTLVWALIGLMAFVFWGIHETRADHPLVDLAMVAKGPILLANVTSLTVSFSIYGTNLLIPQLLQQPGTSGRGIGMNMLSSSLFLVPAGLFQILSAPVAARVSTRFSAGISLLVGSGTAAGAWIFGCFFFNSPWHAIVISIACGIGLGFSYSSTPLIIMNVALPGQTASATGFNSLMWSLGIAFAAASLGAVLSPGIPPPQTGPEELALSAPYLVPNSICAAAGIIATGLACFHIAAAPVGTK